MTLATFSAFFEWRKTEASILVSNFDRTYYIVLYTVRHSRNAATELLSIEYVQVRFKHRIEHSKLRTRYKPLFNDTPSFKRCRYRLSSGIFDAYSLVSYHIEFISFEWRSWVVLSTVQYCTVLSTSTVLSTWFIGLTIPWRSGTPSPWNGLTVNRFLLATSDMPVVYDTIPVVYDTSVATLVYHTVVLYSGTVLINVLYHWTVPLIVYR